MNGYDIADKLSPFLGNPVFNAMCRVYSRASTGMRNRYWAFVHSQGAETTVDDVVDFIENDAEWLAVVLAEQLGGGK